MRGCSVWRCVVPWFVVCVCVVCVLVCVVWHAGNPRVCIQNVPVCAFKTFPCVPATYPHPKICPRRVITCFRGSPQETFGSYRFQGMRTGREQHVPDSSNHSLYLIKLFSFSNIEGNFGECATSTHTTHNAHRHRNTAHHTTPTHTTSHGDRETEKEDRERERREDERQETRQDKTRQDKTRQDKTRQDKTRQDKTRQDKTRQDKTRQDKTRQDKTRQDKTRQDTHTLTFHETHYPPPSRVKLLKQVKNDTVPPRTLGQIV